MAIPIRHSDPAHIKADCRTFFVTSSIAGKLPRLQTTRAATLFIETLYHYRDQHNYLLHEFVVMPDHFHLLISVDSSTTVEKAVQLIKGGFAFRAGKALNFKAPVWQRGFSEIRVLDARAYANQREYMHQNPVARHLAPRPEDYAFSSACSNYELDPPPQGLKPSSYSESFGMAKAMP